MTEEGGAEVAEDPTSDGGAEVAEDPTSDDSNSFQDCTEVRYFIDYGCCTQIYFTYLF